MRGFFCALFAGILCLESIGGFCRQGYVSEGIREQATHLFNETAEKEAGQLQEDLHLYAQAAVLLDADSGRVLYGKNEETPMAMASTTKIMTCILVLENAKVEEEVSISAYAATMPKVKLYVKKGEHYTVRELLFSLMLESHNDAAAALAEYIGGKLLGETKETSEHTTEESKAALHRFAQAMNEKAVEIGCEDTWFITPNGLDATETLTLPDGSILEKEHHTTAKDLACILRYCIRESSQRDLFREITRTQEYCFTENGRSFQCHNHNAFLQMMDGAFTGKTRFTNKAGYCYVGALERDGKCMIVALLACGWPNHKTYKWSDSRELFGYGLENFVYRKFGEEEFSGREQYLMPIPVTEAQDEELTGEVQLAVELDPEAEGAEGLLMRADEKVEILYRKEKELKAPVKEGTTVGEICYLVDGEIWLRATSMAAGYWRCGALIPLLNDQGWFATRDRGELCEGKLRVIGRLDNLFFSGGEGIQPEAVEKVIAQHPAVSQVFVVPVDCPEFGQRPVAVVDAEPTLNLPEMAIWVKDKLAGFQQPYRWLVLPDAMKGTGIKVSRHQLKLWVSKQIH